MLFRIKEHLSPCSGETPILPPYDLAVPVGTVWGSVFVLFFEHVCMVSIEEEVLVWRIISHCFSVQLS